MHCGCGCSGGPSQRAVVGDELPQHKPSESHGGGKVRRGKSYDYYLNFLRAASREGPHRFADQFIWLDGGSFAFVLLHKGEKIVVLFPHPDRWKPEARELPRSVIC